MTLIIPSRFQPQSYEEGAYKRWWDQGYFSADAGGLLCGACEAAAAAKFRVDGAALAALAALSAAQAGRKVALPEKQARAVNRLLAYYITHQLGRPPKMLRLVAG